MNLLDELRLILAESMDYKTAISLDTEFYSDEVDQIWYVFGDKSGYRYSEWPDEDSADSEAERMNHLHGGLKK